MRTEKTDLYAYFRVPRCGNGGWLTGWNVETSAQVSSHRSKPAVLILPGGAYRHTSAREAEPVALRFAAEGYAAFVLEYSCAPSSFPVAIREAAMAMRFIRERAQEYEVNPAMVAAIGFSAGGHLCGTLGTMYDCPEVSDIAPSERIRPDALGLCYPVAVSWGSTHEESFDNISAGDDALRGRLSLDRLVRADMPPVFLWHTRDDSSVPARNSLVLAQSLDEAGVDFTMHVYRHGKHGLSTADHMVYPAHGVPDISWDVPGWVESMQRFFAEIGFCVRDLEE